MPYRQLVTIPLSTGFTGTTWHLSVAYVPRLHESGKLSDYDLDWAQWPAIAAALSVNIFVNDPQPDQPGPDHHRQPGPQPRRLGGAVRAGDQDDQPIAPYRFIDRRQPDFREFPSAEVVDGLKELRGGVRRVPRDTADAGRGPRHDRSRVPQELDVAGGR